MNIRYVSKDLDWTEIMQASVHHKIVEPLKHHLKHENFELSVHLELERKPLRLRVRSAAVAQEARFEMWIVLQFFDGRPNEIVRRHGAEFQGLVNEMSNTMRTQVRKTGNRRRFSILNPLRFLPIERTA